MVESVLSDSQVVVSTCHSSGGRQLYKQSFDVVIIDEATQAMEAVSPCSRRGSVALRSDPGLLDPNIQSQEADPCGGPDAVASYDYIP